MIFGKTKNPDFLEGMDAGLKEALNYIQNTDLNVLENGRHEIDGKRIFVNITEFETTAPENRFWEAHKEYYDIHVPLQGKEQMDIAFTGEMEETEFNPEKDLVKLKGEKIGEVVVHPGEYVICRPEDAHRTCVAAHGQPEKVRKAIFKVKIS